MSDLQRVGVVNGGTGTAPPFTAGITGAQRVSDAHGKYFDAVWGGRVFFLSAAAAAATAYAGGAAGTPFIAIHNPANSGKLISLLVVTYGNAVAASAAGTVRASVYGGPSVIPTGTQTPPNSALSLSVGGSVAKGFVNTALTGSTALTLLGTLGSYYWATAAGAAEVTTPGFCDIGGLWVAAPGNQLAFGFSAALTSATWEGALYWEELPYLL